MNNKFQKFIEEELDLSCLPESPDGAPVEYEDDTAEQEYPHPRTAHFIYYGFFTGIGALTGAFGVSLVLSSNMPNPGLMAIASVLSFAYLGAYAAGALESALPESKSWAEKIATRFHTAKDRAKEFFWPPLGNEDDDNDKFTGGHGGGFGGRGGYGGGNFPPFMW